MTQSFSTEANRQSGFTLMETLVALIIFTGAILVISSAWSGNLARVRKANLYSDVSLLLQQKVTELEVEAQEKSLDELDEEGAGDFGKDYPRYSWSYKTKELVLPDLSSALVSRDEGADQMLVTMIQQLTEYIEQVVRELTVTVHVNSPGGKKVNFEVTTYLVDYKKDVPLGGGGL